MNRVMGAKGLLRPMNVCRVISAMNLTDSNIVLDLNLKSNMEMARNRSYTLISEKTGSEISKCILRVHSRHAPKTQPPLKPTWAWHATALKPLLLPSSNLWMCVFGRRHYVTCIERLAVPELTITAQRQQDEENLLRHPWTGSRVRESRGNASEMLNEPERLVPNDAPSRQLPTIRASKPKINTTLVKGREAPLRPPTPERNVLDDHLGVPLPGSDSRPPASQSLRQVAASERKLLHRSESAPHYRVPYQTDAPTSQLLKQGMLQVGPSKTVPTLLNHQNEAVRRASMRENTDGMESQRRVPGCPPANSRRNETARIPIFTPREYTKSKVAFSDELEPNQDTRIPMPSPRWSTSQQVRYIRIRDVEQFDPTTMQSNVWYAREEPLNVPQNRPRIPQRRAPTRPPNSAVKRKVNPSKKSDLGMQVLKDFAKQMNSFDPNTKKTWYMRDLARSSEPKDKRVKVPQNKGRMPSSQAPEPPIPPQPVVKSRRIALRKPLERVGKPAPKVPFVVKDFVRELDNCDTTTTKTWFMRDLGSSSETEVKQVPRKKSVTPPEKKPRWRY